MRKAFIAVYIILTAVLIIARIKVRDLPTAGKTDPALLQAPIQAAGTARPDFEFPYRGKDYTVKPQADYELWGLVVSKNDIGAWYNYYHDENSVNLQDLCVVWGDNIRNGSFDQKNMKFSSGEWTCYYQWTGRLENQFYPYQLSNNHLLSDNETVRNVIRGVNIGDQIHLKGLLIDYAEKGTTWLRSTSLSREDENSTSRSGGACEIMFVDKIDILGRNHLYWNYIYSWKWRLLSAAIAFNLIWFIYSLRREVLIKNK